MANSDELESKANPLPQSAPDLPRLYYKYDECVEVFWTNPWSGQEERLFMMMWPGHPIEAAAQVEQWYEQYAKRFTLTAESEKPHDWEGLAKAWCSKNGDLEKRVKELEAKLDRAKEALNDISTFWVKTFPNGTAFTGGGAVEIAKQALKELDNA
jgi:hypothetical protein